MSIPATKPPTAPVNTANGLPTIKPPNAPPIAQQIPFSNGDMIASSASALDEREENPPAL
jgi:hypothetical protein